MRLLLIKDGVVENAVRVDAPTADAMRTAYEALYDAVLTASDEPGSPGPGWTWDGSIFTAPARVIDVAPIDDVADLRAQLAALSARIDAQQVTLQVIDKPGSAETPATTATP